MAITPEQALRDSVEAIGASKKKKYRDTVHPPVHQIIVSDLEDRRFDESNIPEYMSDIWEEFLPDWAGSTCTCLLYTSPSPRDRQKSRMPSSA